jgi:hypothetical protein
MSMAMIDILRQLEIEVAAQAKLYTPTRAQKFRKSLRENLSNNPVQIALASAAIAAIELYIHEKERRETLSNRFSTIPNRFPFPNPNDQLDVLIYGRFTLGYATMADGRKAKGTAAGIAKVAGPSKYLQYALNKAQIRYLNGENFHLLCASGFPQATHEYLYTHELRHLISNASVITECERLLAQYGY